MAECPAGTVEVRKNTDEKCWECIDEAGRLTNTPTLKLYWAGPNQTRGVTESKQPSTKPPSGGTATTATASSAPGASTISRPAVDSNPQISPEINDQCFLLEKAPDIMSHVATKILPRDIAGKKIVRQLGVGGLGGRRGRNYNRWYKTNLKYINRITLLNRTKNFFEITPEETAQLAHYVDVSVGYRGRDENRRYIKKSIFNTAHHNDITNENAFRSRGTRSGAGITNIEITHEGIDSATRKVVLVQASYLFQDIRTMLSNPYVELFTLLQKDTINSKEYNRSIDWEFGWKSNPTLARRLNLDRLKMKLRTHMVQYTFDLNQDGSITVNAQYRGHIASVFSGPESNILESSKDLFAKIKADLETIRSESVQSARRAAQTEREIAQTRLARMIIRQILRKGASTKASGFTSTSPSVDQWDEYITAVMSENRPHLHRGGVNVEKRIFLPAAQGQGALEHVQIESEAKVDSAMRGIRGEGGRTNTTLNADQIKQNVRERMKNLRDRLRAIYENRGLDAAARQAQTIEVIKEYTDMTKINQQLEAERQAGQISDTSTTNARNRQLKRAKAAQSLALQDIAKQLAGRNDIQYIYLPRDSPPAKGNVMELKLALAQSDGRARDVVKSHTDAPAMQPATFMSPRTLTESEVDKEKWQIIPFVFLGRLVENILMLPTSQTAVANASIPMVYELMLKAHGQEFNVDFGYASFRKPFSGDGVKDFPLYYLPISLRKLNNFWVREILAKEKTFYAFDQFIMDVIKKFLTSSFGVCTQEANTTHFKEPKIQTTIGSLRGKTQYFIYGFKNVIQDINRGNITFGNYLSNWRNHIYHFYLGGQIKGAVQNVKLTDIADEQSKMAIYMRNRASARDSMEAGSEVGLPPVVFQAEVNTIGFPLLNIGQLIYIDLRPYVSHSARNSRHFKANGYYGVHKISHSFKPEGFFSTVNAIIQYSKKDQLDGASVTGTENSSGTPDTGSNADKTNEELEKIKAQRRATREEKDAFQKYIEADFASDESFKALKTEEAREAEAATSALETAKASFTSFISARKRDSAYRAKTQSSEREKYLYDKAVQWKSNNESKVKTMCAESVGDKNAWFFIIRSEIGQSATTKLGLQSCP